MPGVMTTTAYAPLIDECSYRLLAHNLQAGSVDCVRLCAPSTALFDRAIVAYSWEDFYGLCERRIAAQKCGDDITITQLTSPVMFFETIYRSGITFVDREGIKLREGSGLRLLERIGEIERDPISSFNDDGFVWGRLWVMLLLRRR
ncbi:hypothetical protein FRC18_005981 [Serendipita sp. 400]|nr:hypothetical protein FRC18_005981 [Serendipita sp. 400]